MSIATRELRTNTKPVCQCPECRARAGGQPLATRRYAEEYVEIEDGTTVPEPALLADAMARPEPLPAPRTLNAHGVPVARRLADVIRGAVAKTTKVGKVNKTVQAAKADVNGVPTPTRLSDVMNGEQR